MTAPTGPRDTGHGIWDALAVGWALSSLDAEDEVAFAAHLSGCERCAASVREALHTVADLAYALPDEAPPPALKERIMAAVRAEPRRAGRPPAPAGPGEPVQRGPLGEDDWFAKPVPRRPTGGSADGRFPPREAPGAGAPGAGRLAVGAPFPGGPSTAGGDEPGRTAGKLDGSGRTEVDDADRRSGPDRGRHAAAEEGEDRTVAPFERRASRRWTRVAAAAAVLVLLGALGAWNLRLRADRSDLRQVVAQRSAEVAQRDALVAQREATIRQLTESGPARVAALTSTGKPSADRSATVVVRGDRIEIITEGLTASPSGTSYWLWTLRCDTPQPTDLRPIHGFTVPQAQFSVRSIGSDPGFSTATCFAISEEPGTARPTAPTAVVAVGQPE